MGFEQLVVSHQTNRQTETGRERERERERERDTHTHAHTQKWWVTNLDDAGILSPGEDYFATPRVLVKLGTRVCACHVRADVRCCGHGTSCGTCSPSKASRRLVCVCIILHRTHASTLVPLFPFLFLSVLFAFNA